MDKQISASSDTKADATKNVVIKANTKWRNPQNAVAHYKFTTPSFVMSWSANINKGVSIQSKRSTRRRNQKSKKKLPTKAVAEVNKQSKVDMVSKQNETPKSNLVTKTVAELKKETKGDMPTKENETPKPNVVEKIN